MSHPSGTVTFLLTDIEGSTRRWEADPAGMRAALADHDAVLRSTIESHGGWLFKHTGDGVAASFASARAAIDAAIDAQRALALPVRMGIATGEAHERDGDYFGPVLNRVARVMAAGHGGQVLVAASTATVAPGADLLDLGEHRLRDLSGVERLYQVRAEGLGTVFPPLRTVDTVPGNLPGQVASFVGREVEVRELVELIRGHRLVTLTGPGGIGKTRLAVQVAAELVTEFPDGVWLVELAPVGDPAAVADAVATALAITPTAGLSMSDSIAQALSGRRLLIVLDNAEHLLDAAAEFVATILRRTETAKILATSREGLRVEAERLWPVPSLGVADGPESPAVKLFVERARAVHPGFDPSSASEANAVLEICRRLDGIALAIELAAARMVSMSAHDVRDRLGDRFRLLAGSRRGQRRHQTLRHAIAWSYDLLNEDERTVLERCAVFADGFDVGAAHAVIGKPFDEYAVLDLLDSLVRKSLVTVARAGERARYGMLETIRQFAEEQLVAEAAVDETLARHASYFAEQVVAHWRICDGPRQPEADAWVDANFANLRAGFRWAMDHDLVAAAAIAAHTMPLTFTLQRFEPIAWAEEVLAAPGATDLAYRPRLHVAASYCQWTGRVEDAVSHAAAAVALEKDPRFEPFPVQWSRIFVANADRFAGRLDRFERTCLDLIRTSGAPRAWASALLLYSLPLMGSAEAERARATADETMKVVRAHGNPFFIGLASIGYGRAFADTDPQRALTAMCQALPLTRGRHLAFHEALIVREAAHLMAVHGQTDQALEWFDTALDSFHRAGNITNLTPALAYVTALFERIGQPDVAATLYGSVASLAPKRLAVDLPAVASRLRGVLGDAEFGRRATIGASMDRADAVRYARAEIERTRSRRPR